MAEYQGSWLALLGWSAPARHLRPRDAWVGWSKEQRAARRQLLANNARFCILADAHQLPNLASRALALCTARLSADWQAAYGHPIVAVESFVDGQLFGGTAYKAAGWKRLDDNSGYASVAEDFYERHHRSQPPQRPTPPHHRNQSIPMFIGHPNAHWPSTSRVQALELGAECPLKFGHGGRVSAATAWAKSWRFK